MRCDVIQDEWGEGHGGMGDNDEDAPFCRYVISVSGLRLPFIEYDKSHQNHMVKSTMTKEKVM